jgi:hypothetical protein
MNNTRIHIASALALLIPSVSAFAHHGTSGYYDKNKLVKVEGVVTQFNWRNPHSGLFLSAKDESGKEVVYALEMGSPAVLSRFGFSRKTFKPGDKVVAEMHPAFGSPTSGELFSGKVLLNGKPVTINPEARGAAPAEE